MSTKKNIITIKVDKLESLEKRIEILKILGDTMETWRSKMNFYVQDAKTYAEIELESYAEKEAERAENYCYAIELLNKIAEKI